MVPHFDEFPIHVPTKRKTRTPTVTHQDEIIINLGAARYPDHVYQTFAYGLWGVRRLKTTDARSAPHLPASKVWRAHSRYR